MLHSQLNETLLYARSEEKARVEEAIADYAAGKFVLMSDDEDRENEGDLIISAQCATKEAINFMITKGKGLVCLAIDEEIAQKHELVPMVRKNRDHMGTAFTISVDAGPEYGVTTGISAWDRARTIEVILDEETPLEGLRAPGHLFPLIARPGGVLERNGHTEAAVTLSKLAGHKPAGVIVEVIKEDGEMARRDDLLEMAQEWGVKYITIENLIRYCTYLDEVKLYKELEKVGEFGSYQASEA
ncbi:3,4-dihydroxy-2-butanone-4-phosphate synthase [Marinoscillum furvescens]|uniref:3,4-dihydroxy-2-butanone 4-phosphate synthase n=1 Tax=Marinoscillum furvescens DSM 4134 TaxID=1122208 RepID=A0A3D9L044_MARFU|nr:3,4-dihydroxy-2-butanone-4-phosphate synthase [Marinoscillum furvescens]RED93031.1 3,4-dihydroxy-2-butanone 4-phosphate synthase [Marinoscillum furvescens DSM 4134]